MQTGNINVKTENIFPIIKKFLYSDHEIFLREIVSNAVDATQKLKTLASIGEFKGEIGDTVIEVSIDKTNKSITIKDKGIGMTAEEVEKYINQIAFSGAEEFVEKYKNSTNAIIGHFGLGFYSSFMVSKKVEVKTKSFKEGSKAVRWECDGSPNYTLEEIDKADRGTEIVMFVAEDSEEFLEDGRISGILKKYCKFLPVEIQFGTNKKTEKDAEDKDITVEIPNIINNPSPAWTKKPADLKDEDYKSFYRELYPYSFEDPLFNIHLNVDYPFNLTGILFFPKLKKNFEANRDKIQLYCNQVFVTDSVEGIVPDFLTLLHGVLDSPDIPLNVSRSFLQSDSNVKKISSHISKKVADKLEEMFKNNREDFEAKWDDIKIFIEYGMISDEKFKERASKFSLFKNTENKYFTFEEYSEHIKTQQTDKNKEVVYLYANNVVEQHAYIQNAKDRGYDVLVLDGALDNHFINMLEQQHENTRFKRVDSEVLDKLIEKDELLPSKLSEDEKNKLKPLVEECVEKGSYSVVFENLSDTEQPMMITQPEFMRRMKDMSALGGGMSYMGNMPDHYNLIVNVNHPSISKILNEIDTHKQNDKLKQLVDLAMLSQNLLKGEKLTQFIQRSVQMID